MQPKPTNIHAALNALVGLNAAVEFLKTKEGKKCVSDYSSAAAELRNLTGGQAGLEAKEKEMSERLAECTKLQGDILSKEAELDAREKRIEGWVKSTEEALEKREARLAEAEKNLNAAAEKRDADLRQREEVFKAHQGEFNVERQRFLALKKETEELRASLDEKAARLSEVIGA